MQRQIVSTGDAGKHHSLPLVFRRADNQPLATQNLNGI